LEFVYGNTILSSVPATVSLLECRRQSVTKPCLSPLTIIKKVSANVLTDLMALLACNVVPVVDQLVLTVFQKLLIGAYRNNSRVGSSMPPACRIALPPHDTHVNPP